MHGAMRRFVAQKTALVEQAMHRSQAASRTMPAAEELGGDADETTSG
jgi:hypothetical protein